MGNSSSNSSINNTSNQTFITKHTVDILNKNTNEAVANALIKNDSTCQSVSEIGQTISFAGCEVKGDINVTGVKQKAIITVDFSCVNAFKAEQEMAQALLSELVSDIQSKMDAKSLNDMNNNAENQASTSGIFGGKSSTNSDVKNTYNLKVVNNTDTNIQNVIANSLQTNFNVESIQKCINQAAINQKINFENCKAGGNLNVSELEQVAGISTVVNCVNDSGTVQKVMNEAGNTMGVVVENETKIESTNNMTTRIKGVAESIGLGNGCPSCPCPGCNDPSGCLMWCIGICVCIVLCCLFSYCGGPIFSLLTSGSKSKPKPVEVD